jgi:hypothetical protein
MKSLEFFIIGDSHIRGCSEKLANSLGKGFRVIGITKPNANVSAILNSMNLKNDKLSKSDAVIFCGGFRDKVLFGTKTNFEFCKKFGEYKCDYSDCSSSF